MKKLLLLVAVFVLGSTGFTFAQDPVKKEKPATEQTEDKKEEAKEKPNQEAPAKEKTEAEKPATEEKADETPSQSAE